MEEEAEDSWFTLPYSGDEDVDWTRFEVAIIGPVHYSSGKVLTPSMNTDDTRPSPYADGLFRIRLIIPDDYPRSAPSIEFLTKIWHPNIHYETGKPCIDLLREQWKATMTIKDLLLILRDLLASPNAGMFFSFFFLSCILFHMSLYGVCFSFTYFFFSFNV